MSFVLFGKKKYTDGDKLISVFYLLGIPVRKKVKASGFVKKYLFGIKVSKHRRQPEIAFSGGGQLFAKFVCGYSKLLSCSEASNV